MYRFWQKWCTIVLSIFFGKTASLWKFCFPNSLKHSWSIWLEDFIRDWNAPAFDGILFHLTFYLFQSSNYTSSVNFFCKSLLAVKNNEFLWLYNETTGSLKHLVLICFMSVDSYSTSAFSIPFWLDYEPIFSTGLWNIKFNSVVSFPLFLIYFQMDELTGF